MGLIAGGGALPMLEARGMRAAGCRVACVGLAGMYDPALKDLCDDFTEAGVLSLGRWCSRLKKFGATQAVMVGKVEKANLMYNPRRLAMALTSLRAIKIYFWDCRRDRRSQTLLTALANNLAKGGIELMDTTTYIPEHMAEQGTLTKREPTASERRDIELAWPALMRMNDLDIGQAIAVKQGDVIAVEAIEGTDEMIKRAGQLSRGGGWVLAKGAPPSKDPRFDVPTIGVATIENLKANGATCAVLTAGKVILVEKPKVIAAADAAGIALVGMDAAE